MSVRERLFAALYDPLSKGWEKQHGADLKRKLLAHVHGRVLEIGVGTGLSFAHYPDVAQLVGVDPSAPMLQRARRRAAKLGRDVTLVQATAEALPFADASFDTAVSLSVLCTVNDPRRVLQEIRRVLRPAGRIIFFEHVRSSDPRLARRQDRLERPWGWIVCGCHPNRSTVETIEEASFEVVELERGDLPDLPPLVREHVLGFARKS